MNKGIQEQQLNVDLSLGTDLRCKECNGRVFVPGLILKYLSALVSPSGKETMVPVQIFQCANCHTVPDEFLSAFND